MPRAAGGCERPRRVPLRTAAFVSGRAPSSGFAAPFRLPGHCFLRPLEVDLSKRCRPLPFHPWLGRRDRVGHLNGRDSPVAGRCKGWVRAQLKIRDAQAQKD